jgi:hypothetical protein
MINKHIHTYNIVKQFGNNDVWSIFIDVLFIALYLEN